MLEAYIARCEREGNRYGIYCDLTVVYYTKFGMLGRRYPRGPALAKLKKRYRAVACDSLQFMVDQKNAIHSISWEVCQTLVPNAKERLETWALYDEHYGDWRSFMIEYADLEPADAKKSITKTFGLSMPEYDVPFLWALSLELSIFKDAVLKAPCNKHLSSMFGTRRNPDSTRFFYSSAPEEDERTQQTIGVYQRDHLAQADACIFDAAIMTSATSRDQLQTRCLAAENELGFEFSLQFSEGAYCLARYLLICGMGHITDGSLTQVGRLTCLYDSTSYLAMDEWRVSAPDGEDGHFSPFSFNTMRSSDSLQGAEVLWLTPCPTEESIKLISADHRVKRQKKTKNGLVCWQPYDEHGHFFSLRVEASGTISRHPKISHQR